MGLASTLSDSQCSDCHCLGTPQPLGLPQPPSAVTVFRRASLSLPPSGGTPSPTPCRFPLPSRPPPAIPNPHGQVQDRLPLAAIAAPLPPTSPPPPSWLPRKRRSALAAAGPDLAGGEEETRGRESAEHERGKHEKHVMIKKIQFGFFFSDRNSFWVRMHT